MTSPTPESGRSGGATAADPARTAAGADAKTPRPRDVAAVSSADAAWWRVGLIVGVALAAAIGSLVLVWVIARPLALFFAAVVLATGLAPVVALLERRLPRPLAVVMPFGVVVGVVAAVGWVVVPAVADQAFQLIVNGPGLVERARTYIDHWDPTGSDQLADALLSRLRRLGLALSALPFTIAAYALEILLVLVTSVYLLLAGPSIRRFALSLAPPDRRPRLGALLNELGEATGGFVRGEALTASVMAAIVYGGLSVIGVEFPLVLALVAGIGELVPIVGPFLAAVPAVGVALLHSPTQAVIVLVFFIVAQQIESNVLVPHVMRHQAGVPPVLALFALLVGQHLGGILGAVVAIPFAGMLRVLAVRVVAPGLRGWTGAPDPDPDPDPDDGKAANSRPPGGERRGGRDRGAGGPAAVTRATATGSAPRTTGRRRRA